MRKAWMLGWALLVLLEATGRAPPRGASGPFAAAPPETAAPSPGMAVRTFSISHINPHLEGQWEGSVVASDGNVYFGVSSHTLGQAGAFFKFDPRDEQLTVLAPDLSRLVGEDPALSIQSKIHSVIVEYQGWLYFSTHIGQGIDDWIRNYPGGHVIGYELATGQFRDLGIPMSNHTIYAALGLDELHGQLFVQVTPATFFSETVPDPPGAATRLMRYDLMNPGAGWVDLGVLSTTPYDVAFTMYVDHRGDAWINPLLSGLTFLARHGEAQVHALPGGGGWGWIHPLPGSRRAVVTRGGSFWLFDPEQTNPDGPVVWGPDSFKQLGPVYGSSFGLHGNKVYMTEGNQCSTCPPSTPHQFCSCNIRLQVLTIAADDTWQLVDHGLVIDQDARSPWRLPSITGDGTNYAYVLGDFFRRPEDTPEYRNGVVKVVDGHEYTMLLGAVRLDVETPPPPPGALITGHTLAGLRQDYSGWVGMKLRVAGAPLRVTHLGRIGVSGNAGNHRLRVVRVQDGQEVAAAEVAMAGAIPGQYQYAPLLQPVTLETGRDYYLLSQEVLGGDSWYDWATTVTTDGSADCEGPVWGTDGAWHEVAGQPNHSYVPVNLRQAVGPLLPQVAITNPTDGAAFCAATDVLLEVTALATEGSITNVEFFLEAAKLGEDSAAPYRFLWTNVAAGTYNLTARAMDSQGQSATSSVVSITVAVGGPPTAAILHPMDGSIFSAPGDFQIDVAATNCSGIALVELFEGATKVGEATAAPYSFTISNAPAGSYLFTVKATGSDGLAATSAPVNVTVQTALGTPFVLTAPSLGTVRSNWTGWVGFRFTVREAPLVVTELGRRFLSGNNGTHVVKLVRASDRLDMAGGSASLSMAGGTVGQFKYAPLGQPVVLAANTTYYLISLETLNGDAWHDFTGTTLTTTPDATCDFAIYSADYIGAFPALEPGGNGPNKSYGPLNFKYTTAPSFQTRITSPLTGSSYCAPAEILIEVTASAGQTGIANVEFFANNSKLGEDATEPYSLTWSNAAAGVYHLSARAMDSQGQSATSSVVAIEVTPAALPTVAVTNPVDGAILGAPANIQLEAAAGSMCSTIARVEFFEGLTRLGEDTIAPYRFEWNNVPAGSYRFTAQATDANGSLAVSEPVDVTVTGIPPPPDPALYITNYSAGSIRANYTGWIGFRFTVGPEPLVVRRLARLCHSGNAQPHPLKMVLASSGQEVPGSSVTVNMAGHPAGDWVVADLPAPVTLQANTAYYLVSSEVAWQDGWFDLNAVVQTRPVASCDGPVWGSVTSGWNFISGSANHSYGLVNFDTGTAGPQVALINPPNGRSYCAPASVSIEATASGGQAGIAKVEFFAGGNKLGEDSTEPYDFLWNGVAAGNYDLTARAMNSQGQGATSSIVSISLVSAGPPSVAITKPAAGTTFTAPATIPLEAAASSSCSTIVRVAFFADDNLLGEDTTAPFGFTWNGAAVGNYQLTARAVDAGSLISTSSPVTLIVEAAPLERDFITGVTPGRVRHDPGWTGMRITVGPAPLRVTSVGRWISLGNRQAHRVKFTTLSSEDIPGGSAMIATAGLTAGQFAYEALPQPLLLEANTSYLLVSLENWFQDDWQEAATTTAPDAVCDSGGYIWYGWQAQTGPNHCWGPVNFRYSWAGLESAGEPIHAGAGMVVPVRVSVSGDRVMLFWPAVPGRSYRPQYKHSVETPDWIALPEEIVATETVGMWWEKLIPNSQRFYRVMSVP